MKQINDGGPAFPCEFQVEDRGGSHYEESSGLSIRDFFAAQALGGWLARYGSDFYDKEQAAHVAFGYADAMIAERNKANE